MSPRVGLADGGVTRMAGSGLHFTLSRDDGFY